MDSFIHEQWLKLVQDAKKVGVVQLKRHYFHGWSTADLRNVQLHGFANASEKAYGAVVYLRIETTTGTVFTQLVSPASDYCRARGNQIVEHSSETRLLGSSRKLGGAAEHLIDGSEKRICRLSFEFWSSHIIEGRHNPETSMCIFSKICLSVTSLSPFYKLRFF